MNKKVMNIVNFVRTDFVNAKSAKNHPEKKEMLYQTVVNQIHVNKKYGIPNTFLLQYDAIRKNRYKELFLSELDDNMELGIWFETCRSLIENVGLEWHGSEEHDYDWHSDVGYLEGYHPSERERIIDEAFRLFKETFGKYPRVIGGWILDSYSINYMNEKYGISAACICREQYAVDAYTVWGGYYSGGYYPSKFNTLCPAQTKSNQINVPVFRMLGIDPMYCYDGEKYNKKLNGKVWTLEPAWICGRDEKIVDWYFNEYYTNPCISHSHATTGQENPFDWSVFGEGYVMQIQKLVALWKKGIVSIEKLGETGENYKSAFALTPLAALMALTDWAGYGQKSVWFNSKNYRANLFFTGGKLFFRDITKFDEAYENLYYNRKCNTWMAVYDNLPVLDSRLWSKNGKECGLFFEKEVLDFSVREKNESSLEIIVYCKDGSQGRIELNEDGIAFYSCGDLHYLLANLDDNTSVSVSEDLFCFHHNGYPYQMRVLASMKPIPDGYCLNAVDGKVELILS